MASEILSELEDHPLACPILQNGWHMRAGQSTISRYKHGFGMNDETFRSRTNVEKRIAADQSQFVLVVKSQRIHFLGIDDFERIYPVRISAVGSVERDFIAHLYLTKQTEESVAVPAMTTFLAGPGQDVPGTRPGPTRDTST